MEKKIQFTATALCCVCLLLLLLTTRKVYFNHEAFTRSLLAFDNGRIDNQQQHEEQNSSLSILNVVLRAEQSRDAAMCNLPESH